MYFSNVWPLRRAKGAITLQYLPGLPSYWSRDGDRIPVHTIWSLTLWTRHAEETEQECSIAKYHIQKRTMDTQGPVVLNESHLAEAVHKETDPGAGCSDHLGQSFLADFGNHRLWCSFLAKSGQ